MSDDVSRRLERTRRSIRDGRYRLSEHVVRSLMGGVTTVSDIEAAILGGHVIEVHRHERRGISILIAALRPNGPLHVMCSHGNNDWPVVSFAYAPAPPVWATAGRRNPQEDRRMGDGFTACFFCGGGIKPIIVGNFDYRKDGRLYVIKRVPADLCVECGEKYIDPKIGGTMDAMIANKKFTATETVDVIEFATEGDG
jgi:YgiT-type zinc finger domain-containing protein